MRRSSTLTIGFQFVELEKSLISTIHPDESLMGTHSMRPLSAWLSNMTFKDEVKMAVSITLGSRGRLFGTSLTSTGGKLQPSLLHDGGEAPKANWARLPNSQEV